MGLRSQNYTAVFGRGMQWPELFKAKGIFFAEILGAGMDEIVTSGELKARDRAIVEGSSTEKSNQLIPLPLIKERRFNCPGKLERSV
jgi:hypothetical protein